MPLIGHHPSRGKLQAWDFTDDEWEELRRVSRTTPVTLICGAAAVLKKSKLGTQFFAHNPLSEVACAGHEGESPDHLHLKSLVAKIGASSGWVPHIEERQNDGKWVADVMLTREGVRVAVEVQLARQSTADFINRTNRYLQDGIRPLWLYNHKYTPRFGLGDSGLKGVPIVSVDPSIGKQRIGILGDHRRGNVPEPSLSIEQGLPKLLGVTTHDEPGITTTRLIGFRSLTGERECWRCRGSYTQWEVDRLHVVTSAGCEAWVSHRYEHMADDRVERHIEEQLGRRPRFAYYESLYSKKARATYMAAACPRCGNLQGDNFRVRPQLNEVIHLSRAVNIPSQTIPAHWCFGASLNSD